MGVTEHNLPNKDDAPWLDTTYDGFKGYPAHLHFYSHPNVTRVEVITNNGREFVQYECSNVQVCLQDNGQTLKVFLS